MYFILTKYVYERFQFMKSYQDILDERKSDMYRNK